MMNDFLLSYTPSERIKLSMTFECSLTEGFVESLENAVAVMLGLTPQELSISFRGNPLSDDPAVQKDLFMRVLAQLDSI